MWRCDVWGCGVWGCVSPPKKSTMKFVSKPRSMQPTHAPKAPLGSLPPPQVFEMVRPNKYACPVVCLVVRYALFSH